MAQLILGNRPGRRDEVLAVFEDGRHPGKQVVTNPRVWNSTPTRDFRIIQVLGERASAFANLREVDRDETAPVKRRLVLNLTAQQNTDLRRDRRLTLAPSDIVSRLNPDGSGL